MAAEGCRLNNDRGQEAIVGEREPLSGKVTEVDGIVERLLKKKKEKAPPRLNGVKAKCLGRAD